MANTLKFGNGQWATKVGSTLAYNNEGGNFKPLPFNFTRSTSGTRVNKDGLIEVITNNKPRIDFLNDSKGALKLEPSRTNIITYSEDFSQWTGGGINITPNDTISPNGTLDANKVESTNAFFGKYIQPTVSSGVHYTASVFVKNANDNNSISFRLLLGTNDCRYIFNIEDLTVTAISGYTSGFVSSNIEDYGNGWVKCSLTVSSNGTSSVFAIYPKIIDTAETKSANLWGAQLEQGYQTSYIPTQGAISTRVAESCIQTPPSGIIGQTEGTIYAELNISNIGTNFIFSIDDGGASDFIILDTNSIGELDLQVRQSSGSITTIISGSALIDGSNKIAIRYKSGDYSLYLNGVLQGTSASTLFPSGTISRLSLGANSSYGFLSNSVKDFKLYDTPLSNAELQQLTS